MEDARTAGTFNLKVVFNLANPPTVVLSDAPRDKPYAILAVEGARGFRRRLMEMGLVPGTKVIVRNVAPLGDPIEIEVRHGRLSIRKAEAAQILVKP